MIHRLTYRRNFNRHLHARGYNEEGTTATAFDMAILNKLDSLHLVMDVVDPVPSLQDKAGHQHQPMQDKLVEHCEYITRHGEDMPQIRNWKWTQDE